MGKRKRLSPVKSPQTSRPEGETPEAAPEVKSAFPRYRDGFVGNGPLPSAPASTADPAPRRHAPIAAVAEASAATAALNELSDQMRAARENGRMVEALPLDAIDADYLVRDRVAVDADDLATLCESLRVRGQQTPVEVVALEGGRYGLISGWRRLTALRQLQDAGGTDQVLALLRQPETASEAYLAMVEENEIRVGLSFYERARIVLRAVDMSVYSTQKAALQDLFRAASRAKRSKVKSFIPIVQQLDASLRFPAGLSERAGLQLSAALLSDDTLAPRLREALAGADVKSASEEQAVISQVLTGVPSEKVTPPAPEITEITPGLSLKKSPTGALTLSGAKVDAAFEARLITWLKG